MSEAETVQERARKVVTEWDHNNGICLLVDHENDLIDRIVAAQSESPRETETALRLREALDELTTAIEGFPRVYLHTVSDEKRYIDRDRVLTVLQRFKERAALAEPRKGGKSDGT